MSGPFFSGYDSWKTREPDEVPEPCPECGAPMRRLHGYWVCERCDDNSDYALENQLEDERLRGEG